MAVAGVLGCLHSSFWALDRLGCPDHQTRTVWVADRPVIFVKNVRNRNRVSGGQVFETDRTWQTLPSRAITIQKVQTNTRVYCPSPTRLTLFFFISSPAPLLLILRILHFLLSLLPKGMMRKASPNVIYSSS